MNISIAQLKRLFLILLTPICLGVAFSNYSPLMHYANSYAYAKTEQAFGAQLMSSEQEAQIQSIAEEMGVAAPFHIRRMNPSTIALFGYHNAFAYCPILWNIIPLGSTPFLFISRGFFEDLSLAEQRFLIGHELIHIQERHTEYLNLLIWSAILSLLVIYWHSNKRIENFLRRCTRGRYPKDGLGVFPNLVLLYICFAIPNIAGLAYRRQIEWQADRKSVEILNSHDGCILFMTRLMCEFHFPSHHPYFGLTADHPTCAERKNYCEILKNNSKDAL